MDSWNQVEESESKVYTHTQHIFGGALDFMLYWKDQHIIILLIWHNNLLKQYKELAKEIDGSESNIVQNQKLILLTGKMRQMCLTAAE